MSAYQIAPGMSPARASRYGTRTLRDRGLVWPKACPKVGHRRADTKGLWSGHAVRIVVRDFLDPTNSGGLPLGRAGENLKNLVNEAAERDGHCHRPHGYLTMYRDMGELHDPKAMARVSAWLGYPPNLIMPHLYRADGKRNRPRWPKGGAPASPMHLGDRIRRATAILFGRTAW